MCNNHHDGPGCCCIIKNFAYVQYQNFFCCGDGPHGGGHHGGGNHGGGPKAAEMPTEMPASVSFDDGEIRVTIKK